MISAVEELVKPEEIISYLRREAKLKEISQKILHQKIVAQAASARGIAVVPEEIQAECDRWRRERRLEKAADTMNWLAERLMSPADLEAEISDRLLAQKLAEHLFAAEVEKIFWQNRLDFDRVVLYQITLPSEQLTRELLYQIEEQEISFYEAAHLYDLDLNRRDRCGYEGKLYRWSLNPDIAAAVFNALPGEIVSYICPEQGYYLLLIEAFIPAELVPELYSEIRDRLFAEWLASELNYWLYQPQTGYGEFAS